MDENLANFEANFSVLDRYGTDVTKEEYITNPAIGREEQIKELILILLTPEKSAILIGKPGIGKTAIVEGLAYRIQKDDVPEALKGYTIVNIKTASLLGTMPSGESKVQKMIDELKTREKLILFVDEIHMLIGATDSSSLDFANIFKEGLGRGSIKVIGATTTEEYERYVLRDKAFTRRFQKVEVPEPSRDETIKIMMGTLPKFEKQTGRKMKYTSFIQERIMTFIVDITSEYKRIFALGSRYPDVCLTLLKQAFSYTVYDNREFMDIYDIRKAIENSKNIYPDVIKKELPNFDKEFNDIMLEENGEKPVEEWRKDNTPTRKEIEENDDTSDDGGVDVEAQLNTLASVPSIIDDRTIRMRKQQLKLNRDNERRNKSNNARYARIGEASVSNGLNEILNRNDNVDNLDDMLLSSGVGVINENKNSLKIPSVNYDSRELNPNNINDFLLNGIQNNQEKKNEVRERYMRNDNQNRRRQHSDLIFDAPRDPRNRRNNRGDDYRNYDNYDRRDYDRHDDYRYDYDRRNYDRRDYDRRDDYGYPDDYYDRPQRQDIRSQNFDKYNNYFNKGKNPDDRNYDRSMMDLSDDRRGRNPADDFEPRRNNNLTNDFDSRRGRNPADDFGPRIDRNPIDNPELRQRNNPANDFTSSSNYSQNKNDSLFGAPMYSENDVKDNNDKDNFLFGAPMYSENDKPKDNIPDSFDESLYQPQNRENKKDEIYGMMKKEKEIKGNETLFGAPMYDSDNSIEEPSNHNKNVDIFGQLITDNMRIKNGNIVDEFPTFEKMDNLSRMGPVINDVRDNRNDYYNDNDYDEYRNISSRPYDYDNRRYDGYDDYDRPSRRESNFIDLSKVNNQSVQNDSYTPEEEKTRPKVDLNLENNSSNEQGFDDFYE